MGTIRVTKHPVKYQLMDAIEETCSDVFQMEKPLPNGRLSIHFQVKASGSENVQQRTLATDLGKWLDLKPVYWRDDTWHSVYNRGMYEVGEWRIDNGNHIHTTAFTLADLPYISYGLEAFHDRLLTGNLTIYYRLDDSLQCALNALTILEARRELLSLALGTELNLWYDGNLALSLPLSAFHMEKIEACTCVLNQAVQMAETTGKARMKPCDMSNPKYQMRTWLLRLGFIGEMFERSRHTLVDGLDGNTAYFSDEVKQRANQKRRKNPDTKILLQ